MRTHSLATSLLGLAALPLLAASVPAATAVAAPAQPGATVVHEDATGDAAASVDIATVTTSLTGRTDGRLKVAVEFAGTQVGGDFTGIFFDLDRDDPGPEMRLAGARSSEYWLDDVERWRDVGSHVDGCDFYRMKQARDGSAMTAIVDLDCLGDPRKVRYEVLTESAGDPAVDWLGTTRTFTPYAVR